MNTPQKQEVNRKVDFMNIEIRKYMHEDVKDAIAIWNKVVEDGIAFPQEDFLDEITGDEFFNNQTYTGIAYDIDSRQIVGLYILHPNNIGRCGHICNASYAVKKDVRGQHIGQKLVIDSKIKAHEYGFRIMQFNAVVSTNYSALHVYEKLGFKKLGTIPGGFKMKDGHYEDIILHYCDV